MTKTGILTDHIQIEQANIAFAYKLDVYCIGTGVCAKSLGISFTLVTYFYVMIYLFSSCFRNVQCCVPCPATVVILPFYFILFDCRGHRMLLPSKLAGRSNEGKTRI